MEMPTRSTSAVRAIVEIDAADKHQERLFSLAQHVPSPVDLRTFAIDAMTGCVRVGDARKKKAHEDDRFELVSIIRAKGKDRSPTEVMVAAVHLLAEKLEPVCSYLWRDMMKPIEAIAEVTKDEAEDVQVDALEGLIAHARRARSRAQKAATRDLWGKLVPFQHELLERQRRTVDSNTAKSSSAVRALVHEFEDVFKEPCQLAASKASSVSVTTPRPSAQSATDRFSSPNARQRGPSTPLGGSSSSSFSGSTLPQLAAEAMPSGSTLQQLAASSVPPSTSPFAPS